jgi:hypothetical protein
MTSAAILHTGTGYACCTFLPAGRLFALSTLVCVCLPFNESLLLPEHPTSLPGMQCTA